MLLILHIAAPTSQTSTLFWRDLITLIGHSLLKICALFLILTQMLNASSFKPFIDSIDFPAPNGNVIDQIFTDQQQMLWMSSWGDYLNRYDGMGNTSQLRLNREKLNLDNWSRLWYIEFKNQTQFASYMDINNGQRFPIRFLGPIGQAFEYKDKLAIVFNKQEIWLLTLAGDLYRAKLSADLQDTLTFAFESHLIIHPQLIFANVANIAPYSLRSDQLDNLWFSLDDQLMRYSTKEKKWTDFSHYIGSGLTLDMGIDTAITQQNNTWLIFTSLNSLYHIDQQDHVTKYDFTDRFLDIKADPSRNMIWVSGTNGVHYIIGEETTIHHYGPELWQDAGLPSSTIRMLHADNSGNLWFNSPKGVHVIRAIHNHVQRIVPNLLRQKQEPDARLQVILGLVKENKDTLWWFNRHQELVRYDSATGSEQVYPIPFDAKVAFDTVRSIAISGSQILLTGHFAVIRFDTKTRRFLSQIKTPLGNIANGNNFLDNVPNAYQQLWLAGFKLLEANASQNQPAQRVFNYWDVKTQTPKSFVCDTNITDSVNNSAASSLNFVFQYDQTIWVAANSSMDKSILQLSLANQQCQRITLPYKPDVVYTAMQNDPDTLWLVQGQYVRQIRLSDQKMLFEQIMPLSIIETVKVDHQGHILVYGDATLWRFDTADTTWHPLFAAEIALENKSGVKHYFDEASHTFYILSHQGIIAIDTQRNLDLGKPKLMFTSYSLGNNKTTLFPEHTPITISYGEPVEVSYVTTPLVPSKLIRYRYRVNPDQPWTEITSSKLLLTQLPPGQTQLEFQATYSHQDFGASKTLQLTILPPWWRTYWAYASYLLLTLLLFFAWSHWLRTRDRLRQANLTVSVFENTSEGLCVLSTDFCVLRINPSMQMMVGWLPAENLTPMLQSIVTVNEKTPIRQVMASLPNSQRWHGEAQLLNAEQEPFLAELRIDRLQRNDPNGDFILVAEDITDRKAHEEHLNYLSRHDFLTQLPNRFFFNEYLQHLLASLAVNERYALILLDIDDFKFYNDSLGHIFGDLLLQDIANDLAKIVANNNAFVARHSGDEFIYVLPAPAHDESQLAATLQQLQTTLNRKRLIVVNEVTINASLGVTFLPDNGMSATTLLQQADMAMYQAKRNGKGCVHIYTEQLNTELARSMELENAILHNNGHFGLLLYYQPKVTVTDQKIYGFESLARWRLASGEFLSPDKFLPLIRPGKMDHLFTLAVFRQACKDYPLFQQCKADIKLSINLSPRHLEEIEFVDIVLGIVDEHGVPHEALIIEILEDAGISNPMALESLKKFRQYGFSISIDDFGTGYSSLSHLNKLNADELKIDRSFLQGIPEDENAVSLFRNIVELGQKFKMAVICEGIETTAHLDFLHSCGVNHYQGFFFSPPVPAEKAYALLVSNSESSKGTSIN